MKNIKIKRIKEGITQQELANDVGVSRQSIWLIEDGLVIPSVKTLENISNALGTPMEYLMKNVEKT